MNSWNPYSDLTPPAKTRQERMHQLLENAMVGHTIRRFADEKLQAAVALLPLAAVYTEGTSGALVVGMTLESKEDRERHAQTLDLLSRFVGGVPHRLTYLSVHRDFTHAPRWGSIWDAWGDEDGEEDAVRGNRQSRRQSAMEQDLPMLRGGLSLGCVGTLCLIYSLGRERQAAIISGHAAQATADVRIFCPEELDASKHVESSRSSQGTLATSAVVAVVTLNPPLRVRASDSALALLINQRICGRDHSIWRAVDREYHVTSYVSSVETPLETEVSMRSGRSGSGSAVATGCIRHHGCTVRDTWGVLTNQVLADYTASPGDSGAPVFIARRGVDEVAFVGIHVGRVVEESGHAFSFYSTWERTKVELQLPAPYW